MLSGLDFPKLAPSMPRLAAVYPPKQALLHVQDVTRAQQVMSCPAEHHELNSVALEVGGCKKVKSQRKGF